MKKLESSMRLIVKRDTFYIPDPEGGVYLRNNESSLRLKGSNIYQWIEKLVPMFNGKQTMGDLTRGLTAPYRKRVYEIGETLLQKGFVRDISQDRSHQLDDRIVEKYASQIEFIENFVDSGGYRFEKFREANVLVIGSGSILISLIRTLIETGLPKFHYIVTESLHTNRQRISEIMENARKFDSEVEVWGIPFEIGENDSIWRQVVSEYDYILFVSQIGNINKLKILNSLCKREGKIFIPAICLEHVGLAGPIVHPDSDGCWESAWHRLHKSTLQSNHQPNMLSPISRDILANIIGFELFKTITGISKSINQIYLLDLETLEGDWLSFQPHPLVTDRSITPNVVVDLEDRINKQGKRNSPPHKMLEYFSMIMEVLFLFYLRLKLKRLC